MKFPLSQIVTIFCSGETGVVIARSEYTASEPQYLVRYQTALGNACEAWWPESALA